MKFMMIRDLFWMIAHPIQSKAIIKMAWRAAMRGENPSDADWRDMMERHPDIKIPTS